MLTYISEMVLGVAPFGMIAIAFTYVTMYKANKPSNNSVEARKLAKRLSIMAVGFAGLFVIILVVLSTISYLMGKLLEVL